MILRRTAGVLAITAWAATGSAQSPPPQPYPAPYGPYPPPPYGYSYPPPAYGYPYAPPAPPPPAPWTEGAPIPPGYHVEQQLRSGLLTAGILVTAIPYGFSLVGAAAADFRNESVWLAMPVFGPWMTLGRRSYASCDSSDQSASDSAKTSLRCVGEVFLVMGLITDGILQAAGGTLLLVAAVNTRPTLVPGPATWRVTPMNVGTGYGLGAFGAF